MPKINQLEQRLQAVYNSWAQLSNQDRRKKINLIFPFIQIASYLDFIKGGSDVAKEILTNFKEQYQEFYKQDLTQLNASDINSSLMQRMEQAQLPDGPKLNIQEIDEVISHKRKYIHAHSRILFNYGSFLAQVMQADGRDDIAEIAADIKKIVEGTNDETFTNALIALNRKCQLERYSSILPKDDLENHALLNQMSSYLQNIAQFPHLLLDDELFKKAQQSFQQEPRNSEFKREVADASSLSAISEELKQKGVEIGVGLETEFLLHPIEEEKEPQSPYQKIAAFKKVVSDLNARRKMQTKYGLKPSIIAIENLNGLFAEISDVPTVGVPSSEASIYRKDFLAIVSSAQDFLAKKKGQDLGRASAVELTEAEKQKVRNLIACFTKEEAFFYQMFLCDSLAEECSIDMDGVFNPKKSKAENFANIWPLIEKGRFHESLLDMIQAHEISVGPYAISEITAKKEQALKGLKLDANLDGLSLDDPNVQINLSFWLDVAGEKKSVLTPQISTAADGSKKMELNGLAVEFLRLMQEAIAEAANQQGVLRNQEVIDCAYDRKKYLSEQLQGTPYFVVDPSKPAFLNHKMLAAKTVTIRCSVVDPACEIGVAEIRIIGNNPHFAVFDGDEENVFRSGLEFIPEALLPRIAQKVNGFVQSQTKEQLTDLYQQKVAINHNGTIDGLKPIAVKDEIARDYMVGGDLATYDPQKPRNSVAIVPYQIQPFSQSVGAIRS